MKIKVISALLLLALFNFGCTPSTQPIAQDAQKRGMEQEHKVVMDLSTMATQQALDATVAAVRGAVTAGDGDGAQKMVEKFANKLGKISWLKVQHERAQSLLRTGQRFIYEQKSIFTILIDEWKEADAINEREKNAPPTPNAEVVIYPAHRTITVQRGDKVEYQKFVKRDADSAWEEIK